MNIYIKNAAQVSIQQPLCDDWMTAPVLPSQQLEHAIEPDYKPFIASMQARRMSNVLKRAISSAKTATLGMAGDTLDGILTGTGLGCISNTRKYLQSMLEGGEEGLSPSLFMQSTQNTIGSQIAIALQCHNYNITFSHRGTSFDSALYNALLKFELGEFHNALVCGVDEMDEECFAITEELEQSPDLENVPFHAPFYGENAVSLLLTDSSNDALCKIAGDLLFRPSDEKLLSSLKKINSENRLIDAIILGTNGELENDREYDRLHQLLCPNAVKICYKCIFGESFSMSSIGVYVGAKIIEKGFVPEFLQSSGEKGIRPNTVLVVNHFHATDYSLTLLTSC